MELERVLHILDEIPDYKTFLTVDELNESSRLLAARYPDVVKCREVGLSRAGDTILALTIGSGKKHALLFAMPHPNEPIGSIMLEFLTQKLAADEALRREMDTTWTIIKCIDVDGTRLNEGWFKGPFTITNYARHYYRPPSFQQVEWTFPVEYKTLKFDRPMPETKVIMNLIEETKPDFMFSLHNAGFGGVYLYLSEDLKDFYPDFYKLVKHGDLPLHLGEPEVPYAVKFADAVFGMIGITASYDFLEKNSPIDPAEIIQGGSSSYEYAQLFADPLFLVCEMPYFYNPDINDTTPTTEIRRDLVLKEIAASKKHVQFVKEQFEAIKPQLTLETPFKETTQAFLKTFEQNLSAQENWARNEPELAAPATVAERFDNLYGSRFYQLLGLGTAVRMLREQIAATGETPELARAAQALQDYFDRESSDLENVLEYDVIPIRKLVGVQLGCALMLAARAG